MAAFRELWCPVSILPYKANMVIFGNVTSPDKWYHYITGFSCCLVIKSCSSSYIYSCFKNIIEVFVMSAADIESQDSIDAESSEYDEDEDNDDDYYYTNIYDDEGMASDKEEDPESFEYVIIDSNEAKQMFDSFVANVSRQIKVGSLTIPLKCNNIVR